EPTPSLIIGDSSCSGEADQFPGGSEVRPLMQPDLDGILTEKVKTVVRQVLQTESDELKSDATFESLGVDSILSVEIVEKLNNSLPIKLRSTDLFNYATMKKLVEHLLEVL